MRMAVQTRVVPHLPSAIRSVGLCAIVLASCSGNASSDASVKTPNEAESATPSIATPPPSSSAVAPVPPSEAATNEPAASPSRPSRLGAPGDTRGTISCGTTRCAAPGQACFPKDDESGWQCRDTEPVDAEIAVHQPNDLSIPCDDGFDCPAGQTCCDSFFHRRLCVARGKVPAVCSHEVCMRDGARCPAPRSCTAQGESDEGICASPVRPATCSGKRRCPTDKPICALTEERAYVFGEVQHDVETYCGYYQPGFRGSVACDATAPSTCGNDAECLALNTCHPPTAGPHAKFLPWLGVL